MQKNYKFIYRRKMKTVFDSVYGLRAKKLNHRVFETWYLRVSPIRVGNLLKVDFPSTAGLEGRFPRTFRNSWEKI